MRVVILGVHRIGVLHEGFHEDPTKENTFSSPLLSRKDGGPPESISPHSSIYTFAVPRTTISFDFNHRHKYTLVLPTRPGLSHHYPLNLVQRNWQYGHGCPESLHVNGQDPITRVEEYVSITDPSLETTLSEQWKSPDTTWPKDYCLQLYLHIIIIATAGLVLWGQTFHQSEARTVPKPLFHPFHIPLCRIA